MATTISLMLQKGGVGKSTTTGILAYLLRKRGFRVLVVDMDSQANVSTLLLQRSVYTFANETVLEAVEDGDPRPYIVMSDHGVAVLPSDDLLAIFGSRLSVIAPRYGKNFSPMFALSKMLGVIEDDFDFILIDCPPSLNEQTTSALAASDYVLTVMQSEVYAFQAIPRFFETIFHVRLHQQSLGRKPLRMLGIIIGLTDRYALQESIVEACRTTYGHFPFSTVIRRLARIGEFATLGIQDHRKEQRQAILQFEELLDEIQDRLKVPLDDRELYEEALTLRLHYVQDKLRRESTTMPASEQERFVLQEKDLRHWLTLARKERSP